MKNVFFLFALIISTTINAQLTRPAILLSQLDMTASGGQAYDEFRWFNANNASLTKTGVSFPTTGSYRCDISAYADKGTPIISVSIDGVSKGNITVNKSTTGIFSLYISSIASGTHTVVLQLTNFNSAANYGKIGLIYFSQTSHQTPDTIAVTAPNSFTAGSTLLTSNEFTSGKLRGFSLGSNGTNASGENATSMQAMKATGANIARCFVEIENPSGTTWQFKSGELVKLDTTIARAARLGFYVVPVLFHDPSLNSAYWGSSTAKTNIAHLWATLAEKYADNNAVAAYDLINEPRSNYNYAEVIKFQEQMIDTIRAYDNNHAVMFECINESFFAHLIPMDDNCVYSPHGYSPLNITHQGVAGEDAAIIRNKYPTLVATSNQSVFTKTNIQAEYDNVRAFAHRFHVPVFIGEFSCINWASLNDAGEWSSTKYVDDKCSVFEAENWSWVYHAWRGDYAGWESEIPSWYYTQFTFSNAAPQGLPSYSTWVANRNSTAPTITVLKKYFALNNQVGNTYYHDADADSYGDCNDTQIASAAPLGYVSRCGDLDDNDATVYPGALELCDGKDNNCDGTIDEGCGIFLSFSSNTYYAFSKKGQVAVTFTLSRAASKQVVFDYNTIDGTAIAGVDYGAKSGTITILQGATSATVNIPVMKQRTVKPTRYFTMHIKNESGATLSSTDASVYISDKN